jgi:hypothetical protein
MKKCVIDNEEVLLSVLDTAGQDDCTLSIFSLRGFLTRPLTTTRHPIPHARPRAHTHG